MAQKIARDHLGLPELICTEQDQKIVLDRLLDLLLVLAISRDFRRGVTTSR